MARGSKTTGSELSSSRKSLPIALLRARETLMERFRPMLHAHDVTEQQWRVLRVLQEVGEIDASELAANACILAPSLSRILKTLDSKGFIKSRKDPDDGRRALIRLTEDGDAFIRRIAPESTAIYARIEEEVGSDHLVNLLAEIDALVSKLARSDKL